MQGEETLRVLLCWGYHRAGWIRPFEQLRTKFDMHYLFFRSVAEEDRCLTDAPRHYWLDFRHAAEVLDRTTPHRIVFMALDGAWVIALNAEARRRGIPTLVVQHGNFSPLDAKAGNHIRAKPAAEVLQSGSPLAAIRFAARSFAPTDVRPLMQTLAFMAAARRYSMREAKLRHQYSERIPDVFVALSPESARIHQQVDGARADQIACIGLPEFDELFHDVESRVQKSGPVLLIDSPNAENRWNATTMTIGEKVTWLQKLDATVGDTCNRLRVKLHPETYQANWLPELHHGIYLRDADLVREFNDASMCIGFNSTLIIPAVWLRPTMLVRDSHSRIVDLASSTGAAMVFPSDHHFHPVDFRRASEHFENSVSQRVAYAASLAYRPDGRAVERLAEAIEDPHNASARYPLGQPTHPSH